MRTVLQVLNKQLPLCNTMPATATAKDAFKLMTCLNCDHIIVGSVTIYQGLITEGDYLRNYITNPDADKPLLAKDIMNTSLPFVDANDTVKRCMKLMDQFSTHHLPVFKESDFIGIISMNQIIKDFLLHREELREV